MALLARRGICRVAAPSNEETPRVARSVARAPVIRLSSPRIERTAVVGRQSANPRMLGRYFDLQLTPTEPRPSKGRVRRPDVQPLAYRMAIDKKPNYI
jgi:hypothetical protein